MVNKQGQFLLRFPIEDKDKLDLIAGERQTSDLIRGIIHNWLNEHYPDQTAILAKKRNLYEQIAKLDKYLDNIGQVEATQSMDAKVRKQFLEDQEDAIHNMLWITYITKQADNTYYTNWNETLQFDSKSELKAFLKKKWEECGREELIKYRHKNTFIKARMKIYIDRSKYEKLTIEEYMDLHNIDIDNEYENGQLNGSQLQLDKFIEHTG